MIATFDSHFDSLLRVSNTKRELAIWHFLRATGGGYCSIARLTFPDLDLDNRRAWVTEKAETKRQYKRLAFFDSACTNALNDWLLVRRATGPYVFRAEPLHSQQPLVAAGVQAQLCALAAHAGLQPLTPQDFRTALTFRLQTSGAKFAQIAEILGHNQIAPSELDALEAVYRHAMGDL